MSRPSPSWTTPVVVPFELGLGRPDSKCELAEKWPTPPPKLIQGENAPLGKMLSRAEGAKKYEVKLFASERPLKCNSSSVLITTGSSAESPTMPKFARR